MLFLSLILALVPLTQDAADKAATEALDAFKKAFKGAEADKTAALEELAKVQHAKTASRLGAIVSAPEASPVRIAAAKALGKFTEAKKQAGTALVNGLAANAKEPNIFGAICEALGELQEASVVPPLVRYFDEKDPVVATRTVATVGKIGSPAGIDPLISLLAREERLIKSNSGGGVAVGGATNPNNGGATAGVVAGPDTRVKERALALVGAANQALNSITNETNSTSDAWAAWWAKNKSTFKK